MANVSEITERLDFYFQPLDLSKLSLEANINFDLYVRAESKYVLYRRRDLPVTKDDIERLAGTGLTTLYIHNRDIKNFRGYVEQHVDAMLESAQVPVPRKAEALYESAIQIVEDLFHQPNSAKEIQRALALADRTVDFILSTPEALTALLKIREQGYYTFNHSVNVCMLLIALANFVGVKDRTRLRLIGAGGILHDLGKSQIPDHVINKIGSLTSTEREVINQHPQLGSEIVRAAGIDSDVVLAIVGQHHEKMNGSGYPAALAGNAINLHARMACVADVYDAMTSNRSYSSARTPVEAMKIMLECKQEFDEHILMQFIRMLTIKGAEG